MANPSKAHDGSQSEKCFLRMKICLVIYAFCVHVLREWFFILHACCAVMSVFELSFCASCARQVKVGFMVYSFSQDENREALTTTRRFGFFGKKSKWDSF